MSRVLVTGGAGFLGRHICVQLRDGGHQVTCLDTADWPDAPPGIQTIRGSVLTSKDIEMAVQGQQAVVHLAANAQIWAKEPHAFETLNHQGTLLALGAARAAQVRRFVAASSLVILRGWNDPDTNQITESDRFPKPEALAGPYCRSKQAAAQAVQNANGPDFETTNLYCGAPVGAGDINFTPPTQMIRDLLAGRIPAYLPCRLNLVDVQQLAAAFVSAVECKDLKQNYILAGPGLEMSALLSNLGAISGAAMPKATVPYWIAELSAQVSTGLARFTGGPPSAPLAGVRLAKWPRHYDCSRASAELGWNSGDIDDALKQSVGWLKDRSD